MHFEALDDECPNPQCRFPGLLRSLPTLREPVEGSRQFTGRLPKEIIRSVTTAGALIGLLMLAPIAEIARRKGDKNVLSLVAAVVAALIVNALVTGALLLTFTTAIRAGSSGFLRWWRCLLFFDGKLRHRRAYR